MTFEDVAPRPAGVMPAEYRGRALGAVAADLDGDGWQDLYVGNDAGANRLWLNRDGRARTGGGTFSDGALLAGTAVNAAGRAEASMGIGVADYDRDGDPRSRSSGISWSRPTRCTATAAAASSRTAARPATWAGRAAPTPPLASLFLDYDGDGWLDLFAANGAVQNIESLASRGDPFPVHETNQLFRNRGPVDGEVRYR